MKIREDVREEIQQNLGHPIPGPEDPDFPAFYSRLELEHPKLAAKLAAALEDELPEQPLFPDQAAQAKTREQARGVIRSFFYRQDPYTLEWHPDKAKLAGAGLLGIALLFMPLMLLQRSAGSAAARPAQVAEAPAPVPAPPPVVEKPVELPPPPPPVEPPPAPAVEPPPAPAYAPPPAYSPPPPPVRREPGGTIYAKERGGEGAKSGVLYVREGAKSGPALAEGDGEPTLERMLGSASGPVSSAEERAREALATATGGGSARGGEVASSRGGGRVAATEAQGGPAFAPGMIIPAGLATGIVVAEDGRPVPVVVRTETGITFMGVASLNGARRMNIEFGEAVVEGRSLPLRAQAFAPDGLPGISVGVRDVAPSLAEDLLRATASGVSDYVQNLAKQSTTTLVPGVGVVSSNRAPSVGQSIAGALGNVLSLPPQQKAFIRIAQVDRGTQLLVTILGGSAGSR